MSVNQSPATALPASPPNLDTTQDAAPSTSFDRLRESAARIHATIGAPGLAIFAIGAVLAVSCTIWAILEDVAAPLAIMAGFGVLVGSACLCASLLVIQTLAKMNPAGARRQPTYAAWKLVSKLSITDASRLWCDIEPGCPASQESIAWGLAMVDAVKRGELPIIPKAGLNQPASQQEQANPTWHTEIARDALKT